MILRAEARTGNWKSNSVRCWGCRTMGLQLAGGQSCWAAANLANSTAQDNCPSSSCGNVKISYPFRLTSSPKSCGYDDSGSELECHNNETIFKVGNARYIVRDINYATYSIWMVDPSMNTANANLSSCPLYPTTFLLGHTCSPKLLLRHESPRLALLHCLAPSALPAMSRSLREKLMEILST
ncbi:hypothetical protein SASPL_110800 [Salvia splendens]|uniref:Wall-associated receptor kinase galacturonan-binding domain-containing protein n=1 Tax=Salvia splendens TaxID=180675 RepID=A0A8X8YAN3_SALSN|nr:hypothetical protein SASPL_110800 [Salvia splendens]